MLSLPPILLALTSTLLMSVYNIECKNGCRLNITLELLNAIGCRESGDVPKNMFVCGGDINKFE